MALSITNFVAEMMAQWRKLVPSFNNLSKADQKTMEEGFTSVLGNSAQVWIEGGTSEVSGIDHDGLRSSMLLLDRCVRENLVIPSGFTGILRDPEIKLGGSIDVQPGGELFIL